VEEEAETQTYAAEAEEEEKPEEKEGFILCHFIKDFRKWHKMPQ
jgi:hypothetical protein